MDSQLDQQSYTALAAMNHLLPIANNEMVWNTIFDITYFLY